MKRSAFSGYGYLLPMLILVAGVTVYPFVSAVALGFTSKNLLESSATHFIGMANFIRFIGHDPLFPKAFLNTVTYTLGSVILEYLVGISSALVLNSNFAPFKGVTKAVVLLPWAVPIAINSLVWKFLLAPQYGFIGQLLSLVGASGAREINWLGSLQFAMGTVIFVNVWRSFPFYTIVLTAGLLSVPRELYESAQIDGAGRIARFWHITLPGIKQVSAVIVVFHLIWTFINFDVVYLLTGGGPLHATETFPTLLYQNAFTNFDMGYAAAIGVFMLAVLTITVGPFYSRVNR